MTSQAVEALQKIHIEVEKVINGMNQSDWELQSLCEGWRVQEVFAHMSSNMKEAINPTPPPDTPQEPMKAEEAMEALVAPRRDWTAQELLDEYAKYLNDWIGLARGSARRTNSFHGSSISRSWNLSDAHDGKRICL